MVKEISIIEGGESMNLSAGSGPAAIGLGGVALILIGETGIGLLVILLAALVSLARAGWFGRL